MKASKSHYILEWVIYILLNIVFFNENMVCINSAVNVKQKQIKYECELILKCELDFRISDVSVGELLHVVFDAGSVVFN